MSSKALAIMPKALCLIPSPKGVGRKRRERKRRKLRKKRKASAVKLDQCLFLSHSQHTCLLNWLGMADVSNF